MSPWIRSLENGKEKVEDEKSGIPETVLDKAQYPHGLRLALIVLAIMFSIFLMALDQTIIATAIPKITDDFKGLANVSWYGSAYFMTFGAFQPAWGKVYRFCTLKWTFLSAMLVFEIGSLICGVAPNSEALIVGRALAGVGGAGITTGGYTIIAFSCVPERRPFFTGIVGSVYGVASVAGPLLGGVFTDTSTWRWCFYINLPIGGAAAVAIALFFRQPKIVKPEQATLREKLLQMDFLGVALAMGAIICFIIGVEDGGRDHPWNSKVVIGLLVGFGLLLMVLGLWESYLGERAMIVPRLFMKRAVGVGACFQFCYAGAYFLLLYYIPIYFQSVGDASPIASGVRNLPMVIAVSIAGVLGGFLVSKTGCGTPFMIVASAVATVGTGLLYTLDVGTPSGKWIGYQILAGFAYAFCFQITMNIAQASAEPQTMSSVTATMFFFQTLGGAFSIAAAQSAFVNGIIKYVQANAPDLDAMQTIATGATQLRDAFPAEQVPAVIDAYMSGIKNAFAIGIGLAGAAFLISLFSSWQRLHGAVPAPHG
ncbi:MFS general substrate transporter [Aspergillus californicus]